MHQLSQADKGKIMNSKKADFIIVREAEQIGNMVSMTSQIERVRTDLNKKLSTYFKEQLPNYKDSFNEDEADKILYDINDYIQEKELDMYLIEFPMDSSEVVLLPITDNLQLKILVVDEYYGSGDYSKYLMADFFLINEHSNETDVDALITFIKKVFL